MQSKIRTTDSFIREDNFSYKIDYECKSSAGGAGGKANGTLYFRGIDGQDKLKFMMEKSVDFCELDSMIFISLFEELNRMAPPEPPQNKSANKK